MRRRIVIAALGVLAIGALVLALYRPYPSDRTPEGAYMRVARAVSEDHIENAFAYLEEDARWAAYTIRDDRAKAYARVEQAYPEPERAKMLAQWNADAQSKDGADVFVRMAHEHGFMRRLRKDMSGAVTTERNGDRATIVTVRGTRYSFRRRDNGIWGLTMFTAEMMAEKERAARDLAIVEAAADDYLRAKP